MEHIHYRHFKSGRKAIQFLELDGIIQSAAQWELEVEGRKAVDIIKRVKQGYSIRDAIFKGVNRTNMYRELWPAINPTPGKWA